MDKIIENLKQIKDGKIPLSELEKVIFQLSFNGKKKAKIAIFRHTAKMGHYEQVNKEIDEVLEKSELLKAADLYQHNFCSDLDLYEFPTLEMLREFCINNPGWHVMYLHSKGVTHNPALQCIKDWRNCMLYWMVEKWEECVNWLSLGHDCVGVQYMPVPMQHFQGNFWWAKSEFIARTNKVRETPILKSETVNWGERHKCEMWLMNTKPVNHKEIYKFNLNPYKDNNPRSNYAK